MSDVLVIIGSKNDLPVAEKATMMLKDFGITYELTIASAHRSPERVRELVALSKAKVFITIAGLSAALPGAVASYTLRPVIGVPVSGKVNLDSILSITQMPPGVPVAAVGLDAGENAAILATEILALEDNGLAKRLEEYREGMKSRLVRDAEELEGN